ncbi:MAG: 16S rRNA (uracil(1498)-N(3))-methyltransferase [Parcubacteria group bacterium]|nr:16S rRNA (uracil(1498)-N(3))-methyltransferase [Parcubacteria group bacterium]
MHRFYLPHFEHNNSQEVKILDEKFIHQINHVVKRIEDEIIVIFDGSGNEFEVKLFEKNRDGICGEIVKVTIPDREPKMKLRLYQAVIKKDLFELAVQKVTEIGVHRVTPVLCERSIRKDVNLERLKKIAIEASEQSGRVTLPIIDEAVRFSDAVEEDESEAKYMFHTQVFASRESFKKSPSSIAVFIGPEGGFTDKEVLCAKKYGASCLSLGNLTLRSETAAIAAASLICL